MNTQGDDKNGGNRLSSVIVPMLSALALGLTLWFPAQGFIVAPYVWKWLMYVGLALAALSMTMLVLAAILTRKDNSGGQDRKLGIATVSAAFSLLPLFGYIGINVASAATRPPTITMLTVSPTDVAPGAIVSAKVDATIANKDPLTYTWTFDGKSIDGANVAHAEFVAPATPGLYPVGVTVSDGDHSSHDSSSIRVTVPPADCGNQKVISDKQPTGTGKKNEKSGDQKNPR